MSRPIVRYPDATAVMVDFLRPLVGVPVVSRVPDPRPPAFVRVRRTGGLRQSIVADRARLDVHFWAASEESAVDLMALCRAHILAMGGTRGATTVYRVREVGGPQWLPDPESGQPRYAIAFELSLRGSELEI